MTTLFNEDYHAGAFIASEDNGTRSRDAGILLSGQKCKAGAVLGKVAHGTAAATAKAGNTGTGAMGAITLSANVKFGRYTLTIVEPAANAGVFTLFDPDGVELPTGNVAAAYSNGGLAFTLADATDFISGDQIYIDVAAGSGKYKEYNPANVDGSEVAVAVLFAPVDATSADKACVLLSRACEVTSSMLVWFSGATDNQKAAGLAQLKAQGVIGR